jgi:dolichyl-diphosphooligosaccharide--protein glycosyltransferase
MEEKNGEDEEISIDFSKIKNFFKKIVEDDRKEEPKEVKKDLKEAEDDLKKDEKEVKKEEQNVEKSPQKTEETKVKDEKKQVNQDEKSREEEEEINIDLSKIKGFFKKIIKVDENEREVKKQSAYDTNQDDDEIQLDFNKIKSFFKGITKKTKEEKEEGKDDEEEISFDINKIISFVSKYKTFLLIMIPLILSVYLRVMPAYLPVTDNWAANSVYNGIRSQVASQINQQYPNLPDVNKQELINNQLNKIIKENKGQIEQQIKATSNYFKSRLQDDSGQTYLLAIDPYYWMRFAKNILEKGNTADEIKNGIPWDNHMYAPSGRPAEISFHPYFEAYLFKFLHLFNRNLTLMKVAFYIPVLISALAVIPAFFIARRLGGDFGGLVASILVAIHPSFLTRTAGGFADTDAYNVLFPLVITWLFLEAFETEDIKRKIIYGTLSGFFVGLFAFTWLGWWYIFDFVLASIFFYFFYLILIHRKEVIKRFFIFIKQQKIKNTFLLFILFIVSSGFFVTLFTSFNAFYSAPLQPISFSKIKVVGITTIWPNVYTTVAEQNEASLNSIINQIGIGNRFFFLISLIGIALTVIIRKNTIRKRDFMFLTIASFWFLLILLIKPQDLITFLILISLPLIGRILIAIKDKEVEIDFKMAILLIIWFTATIYASTKGIRFLLLFVPAFSVAFGITLGILFKYLSKWLPNYLYINKKLSKVIIIIVLLLLLIGPYKSSKATAKNEIPSMNDAWFSSLDKINKQAAPDAIINSWWDFGHWFKMIGDRAVTFDGTSQNSPQAHWIGNVLLTDDEDVAIGILRMLDCSGYEGGTYAFDAVFNITNDTPKSIDILYEIIVGNKERAREILENRYKYSDEQINNILRYTHCDPPENYFITSEDMIGKSGVWGHFGSWDFNRALIYNTLKKKEYKDNREKSIEFLQNRFNFSYEKAENVYYEVLAISSSNEANSWIAPWPSYSSGLNRCRKNSNESISCAIGNGFVDINLTTMQADINTGQGIKHPNSIVYPIKKGIIKKEFNDTIGFSITLIPIDNNNNYKSLILSPEQAASMFTRLFFMDGHGLKHFKKFSDERSVFGGRVIIWKVDWEGKGDMNLLEVFKPKPLINETEIENKTKNLETSVSDLNTTELGKEGNKTENKSLLNNLNTTNNSKEI